MHTAKRPALRRLQQIDRELRAGTFPTAERLATILEVNVRTIRRDLEFLRDQHGAPIAYCRTRNGWHYESPAFRLPSLLVTEGEILALMSAGQMLREYRGGRQEADLRRMIAKLVELLPDCVSVDAVAAERSTVVRRSATPLMDAALFCRLTEAATAGRQVRMTYWTASRNAVAERVVDPWTLAMIDVDWYLIGWCHLRRDRRMFAPGRIRDLEETGHDVQVPAPIDFSVNTFLKDTFRAVREDGRPRPVRLAFAPSAARYVREKTWHPSQRLTEQPDGGVIIELSLGTLVEVRRWVLSWGSECEVLAPEELRIDVHREAAAILARGWPKTADIPLAPSCPSRRVSSVSRETG